MYREYGLVKYAERVFVRFVLAARTLWLWVICRVGFTHIKAIKLLYKMKAAGIEVYDTLLKEIKRTSCSSQTLHANIGVFICILIFVLFEKSKQSLTSAKRRWRLTSQHTRVISRSQNDGSISGFWWRDGNVSEYMSHGFVFMVSVDQRLIFLWCDRDDTCCCCCCFLFFVRRPGDTVKACDDWASA